MTTKWTRSPWVFEDGKVRKYGQKLTVADISIAYKDSTEFKANGNLIAAAPELYEVLEAWLKIGEDLPSHVPAIKGPKGRKALRLTEIAMAKARGEKS